MLGEVVAAAAEPPDLGVFADQSPDEACRRIGGRIVLD